MRGAMIMDAATGARLERDPERGIRVSRFDWSESASQEIDNALAAIGLIHHRTREALALATKVAHAPGLIAELCWSDDPSYGAGYVASKRTGYVRFSCLKQPGDTSGGRVFFVDQQHQDMDSFVSYMEKEPIVISAIGACLPSVPAGSWLSCMQEASGGRHRPQGREVT